MVPVKVYCVSNILGRVLYQRAVRQLRVKSVYFQMVYLKAAVLYYGNVLQNGKIFKSYLAVSLM